MRSVWLLLAFMAMGALAQVPPRPESTDVPAPAAGPPPRIDLRIAPPPAQRLVLPAPVIARGFKVSGLRSIPESEVTRVLDDWTGKPVANDDLARAADRVTEHLRARGLLVALAYFPQQQITDGVIEIAVLEGRLGAIRIQKAEGLRLRGSIAERYLGGLQTGDSIRDDNVLSSLLLLNDLPGTRVEASLASSEQPGIADLDIRVRNDGGPIAGSLTLDNAGLRTTGEHRAQLILRWRDPLGLGDMLTWRWLQSSGGGHVLYSLMYGVPVNAMGTRLGLRLTEQRYALGKEFTPLAAGGSYHALWLLASHPIWRGANRNLELRFAYTGNETIDRLDAVAFRSDARRSLGVASLVFDRRDRGGLTNIEGQYRFGKTTQRDPLLAAIDAAPGGLNSFGRYSAYRLLASREQALTAQTSLYFSLTAQVASKNMEIGSELEMGGPNAVRAYPVGELFADQGHLARLELRHRPADLPGAMLSLFHDHARVEINRNALAGDPANRRGLGGIGVGLHYDYGRDLSMQASLAWRTGERPASAPDRSPRGFVGLTYRF